MVPEKLRTSQAMFVTTKVGILSKNMMFFQTLTNWIFCLHLGQSCQMKKQKKCKEMESSDGL